MFFIIFVMHKTLVHETNRFTEIIKNSNSLNLGPEVLGNLHYYRKDYARCFENDVGGGRAFQPPRLMPGINRGGHFY